MKTAFALCGAALLGVAPLAYTQDKETEEQFKEAAEAAKKNGRQHARYSKTSR